MESFDKKSLDLLVVIPAIISNLYGKGENCSRKIRKPQENYERALSYLKNDAYILGPKVCFNRKAHQVFYVFRRHRMDIMLFI